jgi:hypothetical protein
MLRNDIQSIVDEQVNKDPQLLTRQRGKAAALIEGVLSRQNDKPRRHKDELQVYKPVGEYIDSKTTGSDELRNHVETIIKQLVEEAKKESEHEDNKT